MVNKYPIKDRQFHEDALRELDEFDPKDPSARIKVAYHSTAVNFLQYGAFHDIDGPAAEVDGKPVKIKPFFQLAIDSNGYPFMRFFPDQYERTQTLEFFDVGGVRLRDVTIVEKPDSVSYRIPDTVDQGGAIRQFEKPFSDFFDTKGKPGEERTNRLSDPVLKSDIQEACQIHVREGGLSDG